jgi:hypothetical protein
MDSFTSSYLECAELEGWLYSDSMTHVTTGELEVALPGISKHYGANQPVDIFLQVNSLDNFGVTERT